MEKRVIAKAFVLVLIGCLFLLLMLFWAYISSIVLALLIASAFYPLYARIKKWFGKREGWASFVLTIFILFILVVPVGGFVATLSNEALDFYHRSKDAVSLKEFRMAFEEDPVWAQRLRKLREVTGIEFNTQTIESLASSLGRNVGLYLSRQLSAVASNIMHLLLNFFLMMLAIYYILRDGERLKQYILELLPFPAGQQNLVVSKFREMGRAIIFGNGVNGIIQGIVGGLGFYFFDMGSPILWGTLIGFLAFLPIVGASVVFIPATLILLIHGEVKMAFSFFVYNASYSLAMEYVVKPRLIGKGMRMNSLLVFFGILGGMKLFGIMGLIYGPLIMTIFFTLAEIYRIEYKEIVS
jgi:predicted PurR-regulated permease PerM